MEENTTSKQKKAHGGKLTMRTLKGKQSVRTTFKLPPHSIHLLSLVSSRLGVKQKSLFDQLVEDGKALASIASRVESQAIQETERRAKTYVLSRKSLSTLNKMASTHQIPRDVLVEFSIERLLPVIAAEKKKFKMRRIHAQNMHQLLEHAGRIKEDIARQLGREDPIYQEIAEVVTRCEAGTARVDKLIEAEEALGRFDVPAS